MYRLQYGTEACVAFSYVTAFKNKRFQLSTPKKGRFQNDAFENTPGLLKSSSRVSFFIDVLMWMIGENASELMRFLKCSMLRKLRKKSKALAMHDGIYQKSKRGLNGIIPES